MRQHFFFLSLLFLFLTACNTTGYGGMPYKADMRVAEQPPNSLKLAGLEYIPPQAPVAQERVAPARSAMPPVKVALLVPLSGAQASLGNAMLQAAQMALFDMGVESLEILPRDTGNSTATAEQAAHEALRDGAQLVLGPIFADSVRAVRPILAAQNVNMIAFTTDWSLAGGNSFVMGFLPFGQVNRITDYAARNGLTLTSVLAPQDEYGNAVVASYQAMSGKIGLQGRVERFNAKDDLTAVVTRFTGHNQNDAISIAEAASPAPFDAVLLPVGGSQARQLSQLMGSYGFTGERVKRLGTGLWDDATLASEPSLNGAWFAAPDPNLRRDFERRYAELYGNKPQRLATLAYDAASLAAVLARTGQTRTGRPAFDRESITNPNGFAGIDGIFRFRPDGLAERGLAILEFSNGGIHVRDPAPATFQKLTGY